MTKNPTGPLGGATVTAPCGWRKTTVYMRPDQIRRLKQTALDRDRTMSELLRLAIDRYFGLNKKGDPRLSEHQRRLLETILRDRLAMDGERVAEVLAALDDADAIDTLDTLDALDAIEAGAVDVADGVYDGEG